jgi:hypothetical protein
MTDSQVSSDRSSAELDVGGLLFTASFRGPAGATLRVFAPVAGEQTELLRFDDFIDGPHYHVPSDAEPIVFDRALGEPLDWFVAQLRDHLGQLLTAGGFAELLPSVDLRAVTDSAEMIRKMMVDCVPDGFVRVPGVGLQRATA